MGGQMKTNSRRGQLSLDRVGSCEIVFWQKKRKRSRQEDHDFQKKQRRVMS